MATQGKKATAAAEQAQTPAAAEPAEAGRAEMIAVAAYFRAERRGFAPGNDLEDWLEAERDLGEAAAVQEKD